MSCGCKYPAAVQLRIAAMEFATRIQSCSGFSAVSGLPTVDAVALAGDIEKFLLGDATLKDSPAAAPNPPEDRLALTHAPLDYLMRGKPALSAGQVARLKARHIYSVGQLAITSPSLFDNEQGCSPSHFVAHMSGVLERFGLRLGLDPDELDDWIERRNEHRD